MILASAQIKLEENETARHFFCEYLALVWLQFQDFGDSFPELSAKSPYESYEGYEILLKLVEEWIEGEQKIS